MKRRLTILGSTGSIGLQALDVVRSYPNRLEVVGLSAKRDARTLARQAQEFKPAYVALEETRHAGALEGLHAQKITGPGAASELAQVPADIVLNAIVGFAGLAATIEALKAHNILALANKESLVAGGPLVMQLAADNPIIPVDSEHSAIFQCMAGRAGVREILLTASGGPFFDYTKADLTEVGPQDALAHPTWRMGPKVTVDSATMMNKGLEAIEAHHLFGLPYDRVRVAVHRQSLVHGGAIFEDSSAILHAAVPDMRIPISYAILHPERVDVGVEPVGFGDACWTFEEPRSDVFRCLPLAVQAGRAGGAYPVVLNAANEVAVEAFLDRRIKFLRIAYVIEEVLEAVPQFGAMEDMQTIAAVDLWARKAARQTL
jgi:1-deoxy-D-xylulose-5-phosphate reductoisomerase